MSVHKAKGWSFPVVVLADASRKRPSIKDIALLSPEMGLVPNLGGSTKTPLSYRLAKAIEKDHAARRMHACCTSRQRA